MRHHSLRLSAFVALAAAGALSACASNAVPEGSYSTREQKLAADCEARGGILAPTGSQTGRPETDNICKITGGASRLTSH